MPQEHNEDRIKNWKSKAVHRRKENELLRKRLKELTKSRDAWKSKYMELKGNPEGSLSAGRKAKGHQYA